MMEKGKLNRITDVEGVLVGHKTIRSGSHQTGVTFIRTADTRKLYLFDIHFKCGGCSTSLSGYHG